MTHIIHRSFHADPPVATHAKGMYIFDSAGKAYLDACGGAAVSCLGHGHPAVLEAMHRQIDKLAYAHTSFFTSQASEQLADHLVEHAPDGLNNVYFVSGGSEAVEASLKLARQYFVEIGQPQRTVFIARRQSYHGNTLGALAVGGNEWRRKQFAPLLMDVARVAPCYEYRDRKPEESQQQYTHRLLQELESIIEEVGSEKIIGFCAETLVGATAGALPPTPGYFKGVREICDRHGILYIADEIMCGMGRTGTLYAVEQEQVVPDLITIAKGLGGGYQPIGAFLASDKIIDPLRKGSGLFQHGHTYLGHSTACAAALAVQQVIHNENLLTQVREQGNYLRQGLEQAIGHTDYIGDIRGRGLFLGIELVQDRKNKTPFDPALKIHARIKSQATQNGLLVYPSGGTIDGRQGDHILLAPAFVATCEDIDAIVEKLALSIRQVMASI